MAIDMLFAGIDTSSHTIAFALYYLAKNPNVQEKLHDEVVATLKTQNPKKNTFDSMPYLKVRGSQDHCKGLPSGSFEGGSEVCLSSIG